MIKKNNILKIALCSILALCTAITFTGCNSSKAPVADKDGNMLSYSKDDEDLQTGYYVLHNDKYYPLLSQEIQTEPVNFQWFTDYDNLVPEFKDGDSLVYISNNEVPTEFKLSEMEDCGYTLGVRFLVTDPANAQDDSISYTNSKPIISFSEKAQDFCSLSPIKDYISDAITNIKAVQVTEINNKEFSSTMLSDEGFLKDLTQDGVYKLSFYEGTIYKDLSLTADTHLFIEKNTSNITSYSQAKSKHFTLNMPSSSKNGYYMIDGAGLFKYSAASIDPNTNIDLSPEETTVEESTTQAQ